MKNIIPNRHRKFLAIVILFIILIIIYFITGEMLEKAGETVIQGERVTPRHLFATFIWLMAAAIANIAINIFIWEGVVHKRTGNPVPKLLRSTASTIVLLITVIIVVSLVFHKSITGLLATTGALGLVLGLSLRGIIENAAQGIALNIEQIFKTGDVISIPGKFDELSVVKDITMRNTYLQDFVGHVVAIPNSVICANVIRNYSRSRIFSVCFSIYLSVRGLTIVDASRILNAVIASTDHVVADPVPQVLISDIQATQVKYDIACWMERDKVTPVHAKHILYTKIVEQLSAAGFEVGRPTIDYEEIEKRLALMLHQFDRYAHLNQEEREKFFKLEMADRRSLTILNHVAIFSNLNPEEIFAISSAMRTLYFKAGEKIINQGDEGDLMYILVEGALQVFVKTQDHAEPIPVAKLTPGRYFGEMSLLVGEPRSATIVSLTDAMVYEITKETMTTLFEEHPEMIEKISEKIAEQQMINLAKQQEFSSKDTQNQKKNMASAFMKRISKFFWNK